LAESLINKEELEEIAILKRIIILKRKNSPMKLGILTCKKLPQLLESDQKLIPLFAAHHFNVEAVIWDDMAVDWSTFDYLIFRNTWDYYEKEVAFNKWLEKIEQLGIPTFNSIATIQKNKHKFYLKELQSKGVLVLPTIFLEKNTSIPLAEIIPQHWQKMVVKPAFSAGSYLTKLVDRIDLEEIETEFAAHFSTKDFLIQEYRPEIKIVGETSFIFFNGKFSHAVNKKPVANDFRVQFQYGGKYSLIEPSTDLILQAEAILTHFPEKLLYARVDGIIMENQLHLMEVELLEPDLYFDLAVGSRERFVNAFLEELK
jgi:glutathione synthase/RimK-type ligase-like ATP-grasp enzyme